VSPTFWFTIRVSGRRIPLFLPILFPLAFIVEILAIIPVAVYSIRKKDSLPLKVVSSFCLSRLMLVLMLHGGKFGVRVCEGDNRVYVGGRIRR
jgi:hypothetical protein